MNGAHTNAYLLPVVFEVLSGVNRNGRRKRVFDLGCGDGTVARAMARAGYEVVGVDPSKARIAQAKMRYPDLLLSVGSSQQDLAKKYGVFGAALSLEVIEHVFAPREFAGRLYDLLEPGGLAVISTPYHGYWKNLALSLTGRLDQHFTALWDGGHIKFWSMRTLGLLLREAGFVEVEFKRVGRVPPLAKSLVAVAQKRK
jgi:2-polyprenyl-3-methyl-5-hydroxy-6-metoxy-1,4-benzoquinol methylase